LRGQLTDLRRERVGDDISGETGWGSDEHREAAVCTAGHSHLHVCSCCAPRDKIGREGAGARRTRHADNPFALSPDTKGDTLQAAKYLPARGMPMTESNKGPASGDDGGSWFAAIFFGLLVAAAVLFTLYVLLWDGGAHT
jgi:hypothetical protein